MVTSKAPAGNSNMPSTSTNSQTVSAPEVFRAEPLPKHTAGYADLEAAKPGTICSAAAYQWWQQAWDGSACTPRRCSGGGLQPEDKPNYSSVMGKNQRSNINPAFTAQS